MLYVIHMLYIIFEIFKESSQYELLSFYAKNYNSDQILFACRLS